MIRSSAEIPFFSLWRDAGRLAALAHPQYLTTARYEPTVFRKLGSGHVDLLFESHDESCIVGGIRLLPNFLIVRERSPLVWPSATAAIIDEAQLGALEEAITPWLRSLARGRVMASESIRRFARSERFERARATGLIGAAPLRETMPRMAPFVYARRFARSKHVRLACANAALGSAVLGDIASRIDHVDVGDREEAFARAWYGVAPCPVSDEQAELVIASGGSALEMTVVAEHALSSHASAAVIAVPTPVPHDLLFSFDALDAPAIAQFAVKVAERPLRESLAVGVPRHVDRAMRTIALAVGGEAYAAGGDDLDEVRILGRHLEAEGLRVHLVTQPGDPRVADADLVHIFGDPTDAHTVEFVERARQRGADYVLDLPPQPLDSSSEMETTLYAMFRSAFDDYDLGRYLEAYESKKLEVPDESSTEPTSEELIRRAERFGQVAAGAAAIFTVAEDVERRAASLPAAAAGQVRARGALVENEPPAGRIGHLVPPVPFALIHAPISRRSFALFPAYVADRAGLPIVVAGPVYDVDYLHVLRSIAPNAIVLADADPGVIAALYRRASVYIDAAPRPRSTLALLRAVACGALPVVAEESPLTRLLGDDAPCFSLRSVDAFARTLRQALSSTDRETCVARLRARLLPGCEPQLTLAAVLAAYAGGRSRIAEHRLAAKS